MTQSDSSPKAAEQPEPVADAGKKSGSYGSGARILSIGIGLTGIVTFGYFALASNVLDPDSYGRISLLWIILFVVVTVLYRPIEQLLSRTIASRAAAGATANHPLRVPALIQLGFAVTFAIVALALRDPIQNDLLGGYASLYWIFFVGVIAYAASYFARGWLAGHKRFELYGGLVLFESLSRILFPLAVLIGITSGQTAVALGMAAAPFVSLVVVPFAFSRRSRAAESAPGAAEAMELELEAAAPGPGTEGAEEAAHDLSLKQGSGFAFAVFVIMVAEQTLINAGPVVIYGTAGSAALTGIVFNVLLIARAPLQLFQAIQTSLLPHLAGLESTAGHAEFRKAILTTALAIAGFAALVAVFLLAVGPFLMDVVFNSSFDYPRGGLALVAVGMGFHLVAGTLNQAALARHQARLAAAAWAVAAVAFVGWMLLPTISDQLLRTELGYVVASVLLAVLLLLVYRHGGRDVGQATSEASSV